MLRRRAWLASRRGRSRLGRSARVSAYCLLSAVSIVVPLARQASAQTTVTVPDGEDLATCATCTPANGTSTPVAGDVWQLESNAILTSQKQLPSTLTIIGATGGSTITLNNGSATASPTLFGYFVGPTSSSTTTLALSNVTITGANNVGGNTVGGAISGPFTQSLTIPITGSVTFSNNTVTGGGSGGAAIYTGNGGMTPSPGSVSIENTDQASSNSVTFSNNTVTGTGSGGGAISARGSVSIGTSASPVASVTLTGNTASNYFGGGIYATPSTVAGSPPGEVSIYSNEITLSDNTSGAGGGAIYAQNGITINGNTIAASGNKDVAFGGALEANNNITISGNSITFSNNEATQNPSVTTGPTGGAARSKLAALPPTPTSR